MIKLEVSSDGFNLSADTPITVYVAEGTEGGIIVDVYEGIGADKTLGVVGSYDTINMHHLDNKSWSDTPSYTSDEYAARNDGVCPQCANSNINSVGGFDGNSQRVVCLSCNASWTDTYLLTGYNDLEVKSGEEN